MHEDMTTLRAPKPGGAASWHLLPGRRQSISIGYPHLSEVKIQLFSFNCHTDNDKKNYSHDHSKQ